jgi:sec-independent protein translocase protein TatA
VVGDILQPTHLIFILVIALLVLGPKRLPEVGRSLGRGLRDFKGALSGEEPERHHDEVSSSTMAPDPAPAFEPEPTYEPPAETHEPVATTYDATTEAVHDDVHEVAAEPEVPTSPFAAAPEVPASPFAAEPEVPTSPFAGLSSQHAEAEPAAAAPEPQPAGATAASDSAERAS